MFMQIWKRVPLNVALSLGQALGISTFLCGFVFRSRTLRALGLPSVVKRNFRRGNLDRARTRAVELLELAEADPDDWNYGNAVHEARQMLGRVALASGDLDTASAELIASARVPGSPQLDSFGPNMQLALELLQAGRKVPVLEYFHLCGNFWQLGRSQLRTWSVDVENGRQLTCFVNRAC